MKIGFFGGAFDPITITHLRLAEFLVNNGWLDLIYIMPCYVSYYNKKMASPLQRLVMCERAVACLGNSQVQVCDHEIVNQSTGTVQEIWDELTTRYNCAREHDLYFVIGLDNANKIHAWTNPDEVLQKIKFLVITRHWEEIIDDHWYHQEPHQIVHDFVSDSVSSTLVREAIAKHRSSELITSEVQSYIQQHQLYH